MQLELVAGRFLTTHNIDIIVWKNLKTHPLCKVKTITLNLPDEVNPQMAVCAFCLFLTHHLCHVDCLDRRVMVGRQDKTDQQCGQTDE